MVEIHYKIPWRASGSFPGFHSSQQKGGGLQFRNHVPLIDAPDPRRFDISASLRDPFEQIRVRIYQQTSAIPIYVIADLSASMKYQGLNNKMDVLADIIASLSYSAYRTGDTFGLVACADQQFEPWVFPPTLNRAVGLELSEKIRLLKDSGHNGANKQNNANQLGKNSEGLLMAADNMGSRRALVFLLSDFHFPLGLLDKVMASLAYHDVVPVMLWDKQEYEQLPDYGLAYLKDAETNKSRMLLMRPSLKKRIQRQFLERHEKITKILSQYGRLPLLLENGFNPDEITHYFYA